MNKYIYLIVGLSITGFTIGYMMGGYATPVVSVVIPLLFGLIVVSFGLLQQVKTKNIPENILNNKELLEFFFDKADKTSKEILKVVGMALIFFSSFYLVGIYAGSTTRINLLFKDSPGFPWSEENKPSKISDARTWLNWQIELKNEAYTNDEISTLYQIHYTELKKHDKKQKYRRSSALNPIRSFFIKNKTKSESPFSTRR